VKSPVRAARSGHDRRRQPLIAVLILGLAAVLTVSGCAAGKVSQTANQVSDVDGGSATVGEIGIRNALLQTPDGAKWAAGSDVTVQFWLTNEGKLADTLSQISTPGAQSVAISGKASVEGQSRKQFGADSDVTVTVKGLTADLTYGQTLPLTFVFANAGQVTTNVPIQVPDHRTGPRETAHIQPTEPGSVWGQGEANGAATSGGEGSATTGPSGTAGSAAPSSAPPSAPSSAPVSTSG
jgi:periplasmic copper chaperone A